MVGGARAEIQYISSVPSALTLIRRLNIPTTSHEVYAYPGLSSEFCGVRAPRSSERCKIRCSRRSSRFQARAIAIRYEILSKRGCTTRRRKPNLLERKVVEKGAVAAGADAGDPGPRARHRHRHRDHRAVHVPAGQVSWILVSYSVVLLYGGSREDGYTTGGNCHAH